MAYHKLNSLSLTPMQQAAGYFIFLFDFACAKQVRATATKGEHSHGSPLETPSCKVSATKPRSISNPRSKLRGKVY